MTAEADLKVAGEVLDALLRGDEEMAVSVWDYPDGIDSLSHYYTERVVRLVLRPFGLGVRCYNGIKVAPLNPRRPVTDSARDMARDLAVKCGLLVDIPDRAAAEAGDPASYRGRESDALAGS